jgi:hypothetical protein
VPGPLLQCQLSQPTDRIPHAPKCQGDRTVRALHCQWTAHRRCTHVTVDAPSLSLPTVSPRYHLRHPPPHPICHYRLKPSPFPPLRAPHRSLCSVTLELTLRGAASHQPPPISAASSTTVPMCQAPPVTEPSFIREPHRHVAKIAKAVSRLPPSSTGTSLWTTTSGPPNTSSRTPESPWCSPDPEPATPDPVPCRHCRASPPESHRHVAISWRASRLPRRPKSLPHRA